MKKLLFAVLGCALMLTGCNMGDGDTNSLAQKISGTYDSAVSYNYGDVSGNDSTVEIIAEGAKTVSVTITNLWDAGRENYFTLQFDGVEVSGKVSKATLTYSGEANAGYDDLKNIYEIEFDGTISDGELKFQVVIPGLGTIIGEGENEDGKDGEKNDGNGEPIVEKDDNKQYFVQNILGVYGALLKVGTDDYLETSVIVTKEDAEHVTVTIKDFQLRAGEPPYETFDIVVRGVTGRGDEYDGNFSVEDNEGRYHEGPAEISLLPGANIKLGMRGNAGSAEIYFSVNDDYLGAYGECVKGGAAPVTDPVEKASGLFYCESSAVTEGGSPVVTSSTIEISKLATTDNDYFNHPVKIKYVEPETSTSMEFELSGGTTGMLPSENAKINCPYQTYVKIGGVEVYNRWVSAEGWVTPRWYGGKEIELEIDVINYELDIKTTITVTGSTETR